MSSVHTRCIYAISYLCILNTLKCVRKTSDVWSTLLCKSFTLFEIPVSAHSSAYSVPEIFISFPDQYSRPDYHNNNSPDECAENSYSYRLVVLGVTFNFHISLKANNYSNQRQSLCQQPHTKSIISCFNIFLKDVRCT